MSTPASTTTPERELTTRALGAVLFLLSASLVVYELLLTRIFSLILFAHLANLAIALALLGIGIGATVLHMFPNLLPKEKLSSRLGWVALLAAAAMLLAIVMALNLKVTEQWDYSVTAIKVWNRRSAALIRPGTLSLLLVFLATPFFFGGLGFSAIFQHARDRIGRLYAMDLWGGAAGSAFFIPILGLLAGPDTAFVTVLASALAATVAFSSSGRRRMAIASGAVAAAALLAAGIGATGVDILKIRYTAGWPERDVTYREWTPEARLALHDDVGRHRQDLLLDISSASEIVSSRQQVARWAQSPPRGLPYRLRRPPGKVAVIAASAGNEVATAQFLGYTDVTAIDIAGRAFGIIREKFAKVAVNPYLQKGVRTLDMDGRAGIVHSRDKYAVIHMRWANLNNAAGLLSNAWSPNLLETKEAFIDYLRHLEPDGLIAFGKGDQNNGMVSTVAAALREIGVRHPYRHIAVLDGPESVLIVGRAPLTGAQLEMIRAAARSARGRLSVDPARPPRRSIADRRVLTDDRPYRDTWKDLRRGLGMLIGSRALAPETEAGMGRVSMILWLQVLLLGLAGVLFVGIPLVWKGRREIGKMPGRGQALLYASAIGYAYLAIETVLIHDLVLIVGHPTYAVTLVVLVMLLGSGIGSMQAGKLPAELLTRRLPLILLVVIALALVHAFVLPGLFSRQLLGQALWLRVVTVGLALLPLAYFMGMPFPMAMRILPGGANEIVPWCWALNGWMSVVATVATVLISRQAGFTYALLAAVAFYLLALVASRGLERVGVSGVPAKQALVEPAPGAP